MENFWNWTGENWIALAAVVIAAAAFIDARVARHQRRTEKRNRSIRYEGETGTVFGTNVTFNLRLVGEDSPSDPMIDFESVAEWEVSGSMDGTALPGDVGGTLKVNGKAGKLPETVTVTWNHPFPGRRVVHLPEVQIASVDRQLGSK